MIKKAWLSILLLVVAGMAWAENLPDFTELVERQGAAVANISVTQTQKATAMPQIPNLSEDDPMFDFFRRFIPQPPPGGGRDREAIGQGSGFIISQDGYMLTNAHVVTGADEITVKLRDKREFKAKVIGSDKRTDVALIKIEATGLPAVTIGNPDKLKVGEWVVAIGSPFGFENSVTKGIVSAKGRDLPQESLVPFIQTDAAINPGNSGGPLFNMRGEVVAINSQIYSRSGGFQGLAFSIPIDTAMRVADQIRTTGKVTRGWLGVLIQPVTKDLAETFGLAKPEGALVASVEKNSPAEKAGLEASDVITRFDNKPVVSSTDLPRIVTEVKPGSKVSLQVWRKNATKDLSITVGELPLNLAAGPGGSGSKRAPKAPEISNKLGLSLSDLTPEQRKEFKVNNGVLVEDALNAAGRAGVQKGDVILSANNIEVKSVEQFNSIVSKVGEGKTVALLVLQGDTRRFIALKPDK
ncbi:MAG: DegQ family serine endoprotease [Burkholderiales bacterium]